eukprot:2345811-Pleurochrysis_carterae.AAC.1
MGAPAFAEWLNPSTAWLKPVADGSARSFRGSKPGDFSSRTRIPVYSRALNPSMVRHSLSYSDATSMTFLCYTPTTDQTLYTRPSPLRFPLDGTSRTKVRYPTFSTSTSSRGRGLRAVEAGKVHCTTGGYLSA